VASFKPAYLITATTTAGSANGERAFARWPSRTPAPGHSRCSRAPTRRRGRGRALGALTLAIGRRFIIVDGVERWKEEEVTEHLVALSRSMPADTTVAFFAREEARAKAPAALHRRSPRGGDVAARWRSRVGAAGLGARAGSGAGVDPRNLQGARTLVAIVGPPGRLAARNSRKLALECGPGARLDAGKGCGSG